MGYAVLGRADGHDVQLKKYILHTPQRQWVVGDLVVDWIMGQHARHSFTNLRK